MVDFHVDKSPSGPIGEAPSAQQRLSRCDRLVRAGRFEEAEGQLVVLAQVPEAAKEARKLLAVCKQLRRWGIVGKLEAYSANSLRSNADADLPDFSSDAPVLIARRPEAKKVVFAFTGNARQVWISIHILHQFLWKHDCHVVYLRDPSKLCYLSGVPGFGQGYQPTLTAMRELIGSLGHPTVYCLGNSGGAYAALRYGHDLGASAVLGFSTSTDVSSLLPRLGHPLVSDYRRLTPDLSVDLKELYASSATPPRVTLVYGDQHAADAASSIRMGDLPTVTLVPIAGYDRHDVISQTIAVGLFPSLIEQLLFEST